MLHFLNRVLKSTWNDGSFFGRGDIQDIEWSGVGKLPARSHGRHWEGGHWSQQCPWRMWGSGAGDCHRTHHWWRLSSQRAWCSCSSPSCSTIDRSASGFCIDGLTTTVWGLLQWVMSAAFNIEIPPWSTLFSQTAYILHCLIHYFTQTRWESLLTVWESLRTPNVKTSNATNTHLNNTSICLA